MGRNIQAAPAHIKPQAIHQIPAETGLDLYIKVLFQKRAIRPGKGSDFFEQ
jgi:hypothetical protein